MPLMHFLARKAYMITVNARYRFKVLKALVILLDRGQSTVKYSGLLSILKTEKALFLTLMEL